MAITTYLLPLISPLSLLPKTVHLLFSCWLVWAGWFCSPGNQSQSLTCAKSLTAELHPKSSCLLPYAPHCFSFDFTWSCVSVQARCAFCCANLHLKTLMSLLFHIFTFPLARSVLCYDLFLLLNTRSLALTSLCTEPYKEVVWRVGYFSWCSDETQWPRQLIKERVYLGSQFQKDPIPSWWRGVPQVARVAVGVRSQERTASDRSKKQTEPTGSVTRLFIPKSAPSCIPLKPGCTTWISQTALPTGDQVFKRQRIRSICFIRLTTPSLRPCISLAWNQLCMSVFIFLVSASCRSLCVVLLCHVGLAFADVASLVSLLLISPSLTVFIFIML